MISRLTTTDIALGKSGSRYGLNTPALVLDLDAFERNLALMAAAIRESDLNLRPHAKSHKCVRIARAQIDAGAIGICCATLDEAEIMAAAGIPGILITSPLTTDAKISRLVDLARQGADVMIVVDHVSNVSALDRAARTAGIRLPVLVDVELGFGRTGVTTIDAAEALTHQIKTSQALTFNGLQAYGGHLQHIADYAKRLEKTQNAHHYIAEIINRLKEIGLTPRLVSGGGTGTAMIDGRAGSLMEIQAGSYIFMDGEYEAIAYGKGQVWPYECALFVQTAVISANHAGMVTTDAGTKAFAVNGPKPRIVTPGLENALYEYCGDEHGRVRLEPGSAVPRLGDRIECVVPHCDPTVILYDAFHCVRGDRLVDVWSIDARGRL